MVITAPALIAAALFGGAGLGLGKDLLSSYWGRGLRREELAQQLKMFESGQQAKERLLRETRRDTERSTERLTKEKRKERQEGREARLLEYFMQSRQNQLGAVLQAMSTINKPPQGVGGGGFMNIARSSF